MTSYGLSCAAGTSPSSFLPLDIYHHLSPLHPSSTLSSTSDPSPRRQPHAVIKSRRESTISPRTSSPTPPPRCRATPPFPCPSRLPVVSFLPLLSSKRKITTQPRHRISVGSVEAVRYLYPYQHLPDRPVSSRLSVHSPNITLPPSIHHVPTNPRIDRRRLLTGPCVLGTR